MWGGVSLGSIADFLKVLAFSFKNCGVFKSTYGWFPQKLGKNYQ